jgi:hypothetical protein
VNIPALTGPRVTDRTLREHLPGWHIAPPFINPHDHLELHHYPRTLADAPYPSAHTWGEAVNARLNEPAFARLRAHPIEARVFVGAMTNLLCGALTVAHHNPPHRPLWARGFPVHVVRRYGWAHSLHFTPPQAVQAAYRATPRGAPFFIHLAEGTDGRAAAEYRALDRLGVVGPDTVLIHGVGLTAADVADAARRVRGLVICPTTNAALLGARPPIAAWLAAGGRLAIGSDSPLTADGDWLTEWHAAPPNAQQAHLRDAAAIVHGAWGGLHRPRTGDWLAWRGDATPTARAQIGLIVRDGVPQMGDPDAMRMFPHVQTVAAVLDGVPKHLNRRLAARVRACPLPIRGLTLEPDRAG